MGAGGEKEREEGVGWSSDDLRLDSWTHPMIEMLVSPSPFSSPPPPLPPPNPTPLLPLSLFHHYLQQDASARR
jgi:hypothetical protein